MLRTLIKHADWIVTMDPAKRRFAHADILIEGKRIVSIGNSLIDEREADKVIDARGKVIIPGMVNVHHHTAQSLFRNIGVTAGLPLEGWLKVLIECTKNKTTDELEAGVTAAFGDLLKTGCTTSNDQLLLNTDGIIDLCVEAAAKLGIRFHALKGSYTKSSKIIPESATETPEGLLKEAERLFEKFHDPGRYSMTQVGLTISMPHVDSEESMRMIAEAVEKHGYYCHTHISETAFENQLCNEIWGCSTTELLEKMGWMTPHYYFAHAVHLSDHDIDLIAKGGAGISHCPSSNMTLNSGACRLPDLIEKGVNLGIGVDGAASNNSSNMIHELRAAYLLNRLVWGERALTPEQVFEMATVGGAKVLGRDDIGYLAPDMAADLVLIDWSLFPWAGGKNDPVSTIVMSGDARMVDKVFVNGRMVVDGGRLTMVDEEAAAHFINRVTRDLLARNIEKYPDLKTDLISYE